MNNKTIKFSNKEKTEVSAGNLYDLNKQIIQEKEPMTLLEITALYPALEQWFNMIIDTYAMLLCHEQRDYTIFHLYENQNPNPPAVATKELIGCLTDRGEILYIEETPDKAWEIWLKINNEPFCYYLFRYDDAVIEC